MPMELIYALAGLAVGVILVLILKRSQAAELKESREQLRQESERRVTAETQLAETRKSVDEQRKLLENAEARLKDTFKALSLDALRGNTQEFAQKADDVMKPLRETLARYEKNLQEMNQAREGTFKSLKAHIDNLLRASQLLERETGKLAGALRSSPTARGKWGEITLQRVVELAGLSQYCDFDTQTAVDAADSRQRPDLVVRLPGGRSIVVDAKVPLKAYMLSLIHI